MFPPKVVLGQRGGLVYNATTRSVTAASDCAHNSLCREGRSVEVELSLPQSTQYHRSASYRTTSQEHIQALT